jgi:peptide/nickel transport system ATP-binding protein
LRARQRPDQLSGGLRQRALIASALALDPGLVIADEPTTALDATVQAQILEVLQQIKARGDSLLIISHDLAVVAQLADEVLVLRHGEVVEQGPMEQVLRNPRHAYTRSLLDAVPAEHARGTRLSPERSSLVAQPRPGADSPVLLKASGLGKRYVGPDQQSRQVVDGVSFELRAGRTLGIVGESGSGKTTVARIALGLLEPDAGGVQFLSIPWTGVGNARVAEKTRRLHRRDISVIYQDPLSSFDPRWSVGQILADASSSARALPSCCIRSACRVICRAVGRCSCPAGNANGSPSPGPLPATRKSSSAMSRCRHWMCRSRPRSLTCWPIFKPRWGWRICSFPTIWG